MSIKNITYPVTLSGKVHQIRFDINGLTTAQAALKALGMSRQTIWQLADLPYDLPEEVILLHAGLNGAKRLNRERDMLTVDDVQDLFQDHLDYLGETIGAIEEEKEAMKAFQDAQQKLMKELSEAVQSAIGFRFKGGSRKGKKPEGKDEQQ